MYKYLQLHVSITCKSCTFLPKNRQKAAQLVCDLQKPPFKVILLHPSIYLSLIFSLDCFKKTKTQQPSMAPGPEGLCEIFEFPSKQSTNPTLLPFSVKCWKPGHTNKTSSSTSRTSFISRSDGPSKRESLSVESRLLCPGRRRSGPHPNPPC